jgi:hypothetical protein
VDYPELAPGVDSETAGVIRGYCHWHIAPVVTETIVRPGSGGSTILLPTLKLRAVTALTIDGTALTADELLALDWYQDGYIKHCTPRKGRAITITITHGYDTCPPDVLAAAKAVSAGAQFVGLKSGATLSNSFATWGPTLGADAGLDPYATSILDRYRTTIGS